MEINIGLEKQGREEVAEVLNKYLANLHVLYTKLHNFHWNIEGKNFFQIHAKLEELYDATAEEIDEVAERVLTLGLRPLASMKDYLEVATIKEVESVGIKSEAVLRSVLEDFSTLIKDLREGIEIAGKHGDEVSTDMMIVALENYEKTSWMLRATLS